MSIVKLNKLPCPTYSWLGVNDIQKELEEFEPKSVVLGEQSTDIDISGNASYEITAQNGESRVAVMYISPENNAQIRTSVDAKEGSAVKLVQVFEGKAQTIAGVDAKVADNAHFELIQLYLSESDTVSEIDTELGGRKAEFTANIGYLLGDQSKLDINLIAKHLGRKTKSQITAKGVMNDHSSKTFKGTIDFVNGSAGAVGSEIEDVLLIGEKVVNKTVPLILCAEEDVEGSHGASIGSVDEQHIFYMMSRGIPEEKIAQLMAQSKIAQIVNTIGDSKTQNRINSKLGRGNENEQLSSGEE